MSLGSFPTDCFAERRFSQRDKARPAHRAEVIDSDLTVVNGTNASFVPPSAVLDLGHSEIALIESVVRTLSIAEYKAARSNMSERRDDTASASTGGPALAAHAAPAPAGASSSAVTSSGADGVSGVTAAATLAAEEDAEMPQAPAMEGQSLSLMINRSASYLDDEEELARLDPDLECKAPVPQQRSAAAEEGEIAEPDLEMACAAPSPASMQPHTAEQRAVPQLETTATNVAASGVGAVAAPSMISNSTDESEELASVRNAIARLPEQYPWELPAGIIARITGYSTQMHPVALFDSAALPLIPLFGAVRPEHKQQYFIALFLMHRFFEGRNKKPKRGTEEDALL
ncbi:hypothetical protein PINS_up022926 [Pythium insidiosum]|nr:hypothetical protein PINS_up022926 [Pythium insidiosum]